jgi:hypothetical protein
MNAVLTSGLSAQCLPLLQRQPCGLIWRVPQQRQSRVITSNPVALFGEPQGEIIPRVGVARRNCDRRPPERLRRIWIAALVG